MNTPLLPISRCVLILNQQRDALAAADAQRRHAHPAALALQRAQQVQHQARAAGAHGVTQRDGAAVGIETRGVDTTRRAIELELGARVVGAVPRRLAGTGAGTAAQGSGTGRDLPAGAAA